MSLLPEIANPYVAALAGGFLYGLVFCTSTCLPYVASYIAGINAGFRKGISVTLIFNLGRLTAYALIGAAIGALKLLADESLRNTYQTYSSLAFSVATIALGSLILAKEPKSASSCGPCAQGAEKLAKSKIIDRLDFGAYTLGLTRGLLLCAPLLAILAYAVTFSSPLDSFALAVLFGLGTTLSPILLLGGATGWLLNKAPLFRKWISRLGGITLILLGVVTLLDATII
jgi:thiol:disulfide interchange protein DsbD